MKFTIDNIKVRSNWFDKGGKIAQLGVEGYFLYITLFRFRVHNQDEEYSFVTSVGAIRKEMKSKAYTSKRIVELLKLLTKLEVIRVDNLSRWDQLAKGDKVNDDKLLIIEATDRPITKRVKKYDEALKKEIETDEPVTEVDNYISINLQMFQHYLDIGLDEKYFLLYSLVRKYRGNIRQGCNVAIDNMEKLFGIDHNTINRMIWQMNNLYLLVSKKEKRGEKNYNFHHWVCGHVKQIEQFKQNHKEDCDEITKRRKRADEKQERREANKLEKQERLAAKKLEKQKLDQNDIAVTQDNPFTNVDDNSITYEDKLVQKLDEQKQDEPELAFGHKGKSALRDFVDSESKKKNRDKDVQDLIDLGIHSEDEVDSASVDDEDEPSEEVRQKIWGKPNKIAVDKNLFDDEPSDGRESVTINGKVMRLKSRTDEGVKQYKFGPDWMTKKQIELDLRFG
jgi:hypothetical protein